MKKSLAVCCAALAVLASAAEPSRTIKACVMQPPYALDVADIEKSMQWEFDALKKCDPSLDLIVLPEASDRQARVGSREQAIAAAANFSLMNLRIS